MSDEKETDRTVLTGFDQTNGVIDGLEGESDGTAEGDELSGAERDQSGLDTVIEVEGANLGAANERTGD